MTDTKALLNVSPAQFMGLWEDLMDAEHKRNGYGGDTAEIYVSRFMMHSSTVVLDHVRGGEVSEGYREDYLEAATTLHALCRLFEDRRNVTIEMEEGPLDDLVGPAIFDHRVHLRVVTAADARQKKDQDTTTSIAAEGNELPWSDLKVAFDTEADDDDIFERFRSATGQDRDLPPGWELAETDASGARMVAVFRVGGLPSIRDGEKVAAILRELETARD